METTNQNLKNSHFVGTGSGDGTFTAGVKGGVKVSLAKAKEYNAPRTPRPTETQMCTRAVQSGNYRKVSR